MRGHKFLIIVGSSFDVDDYELSEFTDPGVKVAVDEVYMTVVTCPHENFNDNVVCLKGTLGGDPAELSVVRDMDGKLWYFVDVMSKLSVIDAFEQTN
jgi:hypothetical protein